MRRRVAERALEDYVREMARRWAGTSDHDGPGASAAFPKA